MSVKVFWIGSPAIGRLGIVPRPRGGDWLEVDIDAWRDTGIHVVVSLLEADEAIELHLEDEARIVRAAGMQFEPFPIRDRGVPSRIESALTLAGTLARLIRDGRTIVVHCRQSIGRASIVVALILMSLEEGLDEALAAIKNARGLEVPETEGQLRWLEAVASRVVSSS